jgi:hypothetical protein
MSEHQPSTSSEQPPTAGSQVNNVYTKRSMKYYSVTDTEANSLASEGVTASVYFAVGTFLLSAALSIYTNWIFIDAVNASGKLAKAYVAPILIVLGAISIGMGIFAHKRGSKLWDDIKSHSEEAQ